MTDLSPPQQAPARSSDLLPKIVTIWREGYGRADLRADAMAGLTVAIVALPLSMAIAIASGVGPDRGLTTAIVGGFLVSALGGSRHQIGGPAGAFIVLVAACVMAIGVEGLLTATLLSGGFLLAAGLLRLGAAVRYIPYPVTLGFTAGIAAIILAAQVRDLAGLRLDGAEPGPLLDKLAALWAARGTVSGAALALAAATIAGILALRRWRPRWPVLLIAIAGATLAALGLGLPVETIGSRFGALPNLPPLPALPDLSSGALLRALPWAASFALLGAIESLLSAVVADAMSGGRLRPDAELVGQGIANIGSALFGGFCVTGTIARTATNVRAGSRGPVSGMLHALILLAVMAVGAPLAGPVPLAALAAVLVVVAWGMAEKHEIGQLARACRAEAGVVAVTFALVAFRDLIEGIVAGTVLTGALVLARLRRAAAARLTVAAPEIAADRVVLRLRGPVHFGSVARVGAALERLPEVPRLLVLDLSAVPLIDSTGARGIEGLARRLARSGCATEIAGARADQVAALQALGLTLPLLRYAPVPEPPPDHTDL